MIHIRKAGAIDARPMADLLNAIIEVGGTTAFTRKVSADTISGWMATHTDRSAWHIAENEAGEVLGYQAIEPHKQLPAAACDVSTFVRIGATGLGIGSKLFQATRHAAKTMGYAWINATIRADNTGGLAYYQSRSFETYAHHKDIRLENGLVVNKVSKRFDLSD